MISGGDIYKLAFTHKVLKIREFIDKTTSEKRKLLAKDLGTSVKDLFLDSLDKMRAVSPSKQTKMKNNIYS